MTRAETTLVTALPMISTILKHKKQRNQESQKKKTCFYAKLFIGRENDRETKIILAGGGAAEADDKPPKRIEKKSAKAIHSLLILYAVFFLVRKSPERCGFQLLMLF